MLYIFINLLSKIVYEVNMAGDKKFGKHLQKLREAKSLSQEQLAEMIGVEYQTISRIETGYYFTSYENLQKIASALDLTIKDLFDFSEKELSKEDLIKVITKNIKNLEIKDLEVIRKMTNLYLESKAI